MPMIKRTRPWVVSSPNVADLGLSLKDLGRLVHKEDGHGVSAQYLHDIERTAARRRRTCSRAGPRARRRRPLPRRGRRPVPDRSDALPQRAARLRPRGRRAVRPRPRHRLLRLGASGSATSSLPARGPGGRLRRAPAELGSGERHGAAPGPSRFCGNSRAVREGREPMATATVAANPLREGLLEQRCPSPARWSSSAPPAT